MSKSQRERAGRAGFSALAVAAMTLGLAWKAEPADKVPARKKVLVELFTSQG
jgi:hypothetical protein